MSAFRFGEQFRKYTHAHPLHRSRKKSLSTRRFFPVCRTRAVHTHPQCPSDGIAIPVDLGALGAVSLARTRTRKHQHTRAERSVLGTRCSVCTDCLAVPELSVCVAAAAVVVLRIWSTPIALYRMIWENVCMLHTGARRPTSCWMDAYCTQVS